MNRQVTTLDVIPFRLVKLFSPEQPLELDCGASLDEVTVVYETYGELNARGTNAILVCHALTGNAHAAGKETSDSKAGWWDGLIGPGRAFDTNRYFVVCSNILGSCYGTTGPVSIDQETGVPYRTRFPQVTVRDIVRVQKSLLDALGVRELRSVCGSSLGGMQVLEWGLLYPDFCASLIPISVAARQPAWCIALNAASRAAITNDPEWREGEYEHQPAQGLALARMIGMISYRSFREFEERFGRTRTFDQGYRFDGGNPFAVENYLRHHGRLLVDRFDANTYLLLSHTMDLHDVTCGRGPLEDVLKSIQAETLCIGFSTDVRYPTAAQKELAAFIPRSRYLEVDSIHGHDGFLIEIGPLERAITGFLEKGRNL